MSKFKETQRKSNQVTHPQNRLVTSKRHSAEHENEKALMHSYLACFCVHKIARIIVWRSATERPGSKIPEAN
jgi:hypothetical protein